MEAVRKEANPKEASPKETNLKEATLKDATPKKAILKEAIPSRTAAVPCRSSRGACGLTGERNRFAKNIEVADVVGEYEHELGVERGGIGV
jgi:hypothetical protein